MDFVVDLIYPVASTPLTAALALVSGVAAILVFTQRSTRLVVVIAIVGVAAATLGYGSAFAKVEKDHDARMAAIRDERAAQEAQFTAERAADDAAFDAEFEAMMAKHEKVMKQVNARADRVLQREADRLGVPVETIDPRITGNWSRWTYQPPPTSPKGNS